MARKYNVTTTFSLSTEYDPEIDLRHVFTNGEEFEDNSYFGSVSLDIDGEFAFVLEADNEDEAYSLANENVSEGAEIEDDLGVTWLFSNVEHDIERITEPMTLARANEILNALADDADDPEEVKEAITFVFDTITSLESRLRETSQRVDALLAEIREAREALAAATAVADGEAPASPLADTSIGG